MALRPLKERVFQVLCFEAGGLILVTPIYSKLFSTSAGHSFLLILAISTIVTVWAVAHNFMFDWFDLRIYGRLASARPHRWRIVHALSLELSCVILTLPVVMILGGHGLWNALAVNVGLTLFYAVYGYLFYLSFDRLRPVRPDPCKKRPCYED